MARLPHQKMLTRMVVATPRTLYLWHRTQGIEVIDRAKNGEFFGLTKDANHLYVSQRSRPERVNVYGNLYSGLPTKEKEIYFPAMRQAHQIAMHDGMLWLTSTGNNQIIIRDDDKHPTVWKPNPEAKPIPSKGIDVNHFNSLGFRNGQLYLLAHNWGAHTGQKSEIWVYEKTAHGYEHLHDIKLAGINCHDIWFDHYWPGIFYCSSDEGYIRSTEGFEFFTGGFPRGIVNTQYVLYVGVGRHLVDKEKRNSQNHSFISVIDKYTKPTEIDRIEISQSEPITDLLAI